ETEMLPSTLVPATSAPDLESPALFLARLADEDIPVEYLCADLDLFVDAYTSWADRRDAEIDTLPAHHRDAASRLVSRIRAAESRMRAGITLLRTDSRALLAFRL